MNPSLRSAVIDKNLNDLTAHAGPISLVGKLNITILDNLFSLAKDIEGRILTDFSHPNRYRVYIPKTLVHRMYMIYASLVPYKFSDEASVLASQLRRLLDTSTNDMDICCDQKVVAQIIRTNDDIISNIGLVWNNVPSLRLLSRSGANGNIIIDGDNNVMNVLISKLTKTNLNILNDALIKTGQMCGIRYQSQAEYRDCLTDLLYSRCSSGISVNGLANLLEKQRKANISFRTDVLFTQLSRLNELSIPFYIRCSAVIQDNADKTILTIGPQEFKACLFTITNVHYTECSVTFTGTKNEAIVKIGPMCSIKRIATTVKISTADYNKFKIKMSADLRQTTAVGDSLAIQAINGKLGKSTMHEHWFNEIVKPIMRYLPTITTNLQNNQLLLAICDQVNKEFKPLIKDLNDNGIIEGWLLQEDSTKTSRIFYVYLLAFVVPEMLHNPALLRLNTYNASPYVGEYGKFVDQLRGVFD